MEFFILFFKLSYIALLLVIFHSLIACGIAATGCETARRPRRGLIVSGSG